MVKPVLKLANVRRVVALLRKEARELTIFNCRLAGLSVSPEIFAVIDLTTKGHIRTREAIE
jgi:hypothetical protein